jgi:hypothetical protein
LCTIDYIFGKGSYLYAKVEMLLEATNKHRQHFNIMTSEKPEYVAGFMQAIDIKIQLFLESCASATAPEGVNYEILDFGEEVSSFMLQRPLTTHLPIMVQQLVNALKSPNKIGSPGGNKKGAGGGKNKITDDDIEEKNKRKRQEGGGAGKGGKPTLSTEVKNTSPVDPTWIKKNESYKVFNKHIDTVPTLNGKAICVKYHVKGVCGWGEDCQRKETHTDKFDEDTKTKLDTWIKMCRSDKPEGKN